MSAGIAAAAGGAEVYFLRLDKEGEEARRIAAAEQVVLSVRGGGARTIEAIRWDLAQARHVNSSGVLAGMIDAELRKGVPMGIHPVQQAPLRVLAGVNMPAVLVEMGYLPNTEQEQLAQSADFQALLAQSLFDAIASFRTSLDEPRPQ
jgi:N-acetylmuramoyl-L-alanine amidase